jgi:hypothetical protein
MVKSIWNKNKNPNTKPRTNKRAVTSTKRKKMITKRLVATDKAEAQKLEAAAAAATGDAVMNDPKQATSVSK